MELNKSFDESLHHEESVVNEVEEDNDDDNDDDPMYQELLDPNDLVTAQLVSAGPAGLAAAAAIASGKKRRRLHSFETNPCIRKRQQTRLMRKLHSLMEEYTVRVGQQAVIICCSPGKDTQSSSFRVFGSQPLECVIKNRKWTILQNLEKSLTSQKYDLVPVSGTQFELPPLAIDGTLIGLERMTQAQLRYFIPEMLKHSTGKSKPGWGKMECKPPWWPIETPWANVRSDCRDADTKHAISWTQALRDIVRRCYEYHNRQDLLVDPLFKPTQQHQPQTSLQRQQISENGGVDLKGVCLIQSITNPNGSSKTVQLNTGTISSNEILSEKKENNALPIILVKLPSEKLQQNKSEPKEKIIKLSKEVYESLLLQLNESTPHTSTSRGGQETSTCCTPLEISKVDGSLHRFKIEINEEYMDNSDNANNSLH